MTAAEARSIALAVKEQDHKGQLFKIRAQIESASKKGMFETTIWEIIPVEVTAILSKEGYTTSHGYDRGESWCLIKW